MSLRKKMHEALQTPLQTKLVVARSKISLSHGSGAELGAGNNGTALLEPYPCPRSWARGGGGGGSLQSSRPASPSMEQASPRTITFSPRKTTFWTSATVTRYLPWQCTRRGASVKPRARRKKGAPISLAILQRNIQLSSSMKWCDLFCRPQHSNIEGKGVSYFP